jgi:hypothetical protein
VTAGNGANGEDGEALALPMMSGADGLPGNDACTDNFVEPGLSVTSPCGDDESVSGAGGVGQGSSGGAGSPGLPDGVMNGGTGEGNASCTNGAVGNDGVEGTPGQGAFDSVSVSAQTGYTAYSGSDGQPGKAAQGGGGGGGAKGGAGAAKCANAAIAGGASGGSGGAGGCGGAGGKGGHGAGTSITRAMHLIRSTWRSPLERLAMEATANGRTDRAPAASRPRCTRSGFDMKWSRALSNVVQ